MTIPPSYLAIFSFHALASFPFYLLPYPCSSLTPIPSSASFPFHPASFPFHPLLHSHSILCLIPILFSDLIFSLALFLSHFSSLLQCLWSIVAATLHLGNMNYQEDGQSHAQIQDSTLTDTIAKVSDIQASDLQQELLYVQQLQLNVKLLFSSAFFPLPSSFLSPSSSFSLLPSLPPSLSFFLSHTHTHTHARTHTHTHTHAHTHTQCI